MKKAYVEPVVLVEDFCLNENIAACDIIITPDEMAWMPNYNDFETCDNVCAYLAIDVWVGTLLS